MDSNIDFKGLWNRQAASLPDPDRLFLKLKQLKRTGLRKLLLANVLLLATTAFIISIWYGYQPQFASTKAGIVLTILAMVIYLVAYNQLFVSYKAMDATKSNAEYLHSLLTIRTKQQFLHTTILNVYFILLSTGIFLYMYEPARQMTVFWAVFAYTVTLAWIAFNWLYTRPRTIRKQQAKLNELISGLERIVQQLKD